MNSTIEVQELPTLPALYRSYRQEIHHNHGGLWYGITTSGAFEAAGDDPRILWDQGYHTSADALSIWNEAHNENARRNAAANWDVDGELRSVDAAELTELRQRLDQMVTLATNRAQEIDRLQNEQIDGDDPRLSSFWEKAQRIADYADYCEVFDRMAE